MPTLIVVSGPAGSGKTTLAHAIAAAVGCPAICRDEIKEGMVHASRNAATPFVPRTGDELTVKTLPVFFGVLELLIKSGVTTVAEAAFQDHVWRPRLEPLLASAQLRIVHCVVDADVAHRRIVQRARDNPLRRAHADSRADAHDTFNHDTLNHDTFSHDAFSHDAFSHDAFSHDAFNSVSLDAPSLEVDTTDGYRPGFDQIVDFVNSPA